MASSPGQCLPSYVVFYVLDKYIVIMYIRCASLAVTPRHQGNTFLLLSVELIEAETFSLGLCLFSQHSVRDYVCSVQLGVSPASDLLLKLKKMRPPLDMLVFCVLWLLTLKTCDMSLAHSYTSLEPETGHTVEYYHTARVDGLWKRFENATEMTEYFVGREDFLHTRHIELGERDKKMQMAGIGTDANPRPIVVWPRQEQKNMCHCDIYTM